METAKETCPHCGKPGISEVVEGKTYYVHRNEVNLNVQPISFSLYRSASHIAQRIRLQNLVRKYVAGVCHPFPLHPERCTQCK